MRRDEVDAAAWHMTACPLRPEPNSQVIVMGDGRKVSFRHRSENITLSFYRTTCGGERSRSARRFRCGAAISRWNVANITPALHRHGTPTRYPTRYNEVEDGATHLPPRCIEPMRLLC